MEEASPEELASRGWACPSAEDPRVQEEVERQPPSGVGAYSEEAWLVPKGPMAGLEGLALAGHMRSQRLEPWAQQPKEVQVTSQVS